MKTKIEVMEPEKAGRERKVTPSQTTFLCSVGSMSNFLLPLLLFLVLSLPPPVLILPMPSCARDGTQGIVHARQAHYPLSCIPSHSEAINVLQGFMSDSGP